jgi:hypothetical protein
MIAIRVKELGGIRNVGEISYRKIPYPFYTEKKDVWS